MIGACMTLTTSSLLWARFLNRSYRDPESPKQGFAMLRDSGYGFKSSTDSVDARAPLREERVCTEGWSQIESLSQARSLRLAGRFLQTQRPSQPAERGTLRFEASKRHPEGKGLSCCTPVGSMPCSSAITCGFLGREDETGRATGCNYTS